MRSQSDRVERVHRPSHPWPKRSLRIALVAALLVIPSVFAAGTAPAGATGNPPASTTDPSVCRYLYEWVRTVRFPLQPDPHASYSYIAPTGDLSADKVAFEVIGEFPYASWTSWMSYTERAVPYSVFNKADIEPDYGSQNPFVVGTRVLTPNRSFHLLFMPQDALDANNEPVVPIDGGLARIANINPLPPGNFSVIANRVYQAFPGYDQGGSGGPTRTPFPTVRAVNYETGEGVNCEDYNRVPTDAAGTGLPSETPRQRTVTPALIAWLTGFGLIPQEVRDDIASSDTVQDVIGDYEGFQAAPTINPDLVTFTRPPLLPGADVSTIPPPDDCSGYIGGKVDPNKIGLIRIPHVAEFFDTTTVNRATTYPETEANFISLNMYGTSLGTYVPRLPLTSTVANTEFGIDRSGGSTIVVWPRAYNRLQKAVVFTYARLHGWVLIRGGTDGPLTTANMLIRTKGANPDYYGGTNKLGCAFQGQPIGTEWRTLDDNPNAYDFVASFQNMGNAAPQGVQCDLGQLVRGSCLLKLRTYISQTGGSYINPGYKPPPATP